MDHVWIFPQIQGRVVIFLKMQRCHQIIAVTLCYVNSVKCRTWLPLVLQTKQTRPLTFLPLSVPDFAYILFPLDPMIGYECWSHPIHNKSLRVGQRLPLQRKLAPACMSIPHLVFFGRQGVHPWNVTHCCTIPPCPATLWSFIVTASSSFILPHNVDCC